MTYVNCDYEGHFWHLLSASSMLFPAPQPPSPNSKTSLPNSISARIFVRFSSIFTTFMVDCLTYDFEPMVVNALYFFIYYLFLSFWGDFMIQSRISDKSNSKNWILMFNFAFKNKQKRTS